MTTAVIGWGVAGGSLAPTAWRAFLHNREAATDSAPRSQPAPDQPPPPQIVTLPLWLDSGNTAEKLATKELLKTIQSSYATQKEVRDAAVAVEKALASFETAADEAAGKLEAMEQAYQLAGSELNAGIRQLELEAKILGKRVEKTAAKPAAKPAAPAPGAQDTEEKPEGADSPKNPLAPLLAELEGIHAVRAKMLMADAWRLQARNGEAHYRREVTDEVAEALTAILDRDLGFLVDGLEQQAAATSNEEARKRIQFILGPLRGIAATTKEAVAAWRTRVEARAAFDQALLALGEALQRPAHPTEAEPLPNAKGSGKAEAERVAPPALALATLTGGHPRRAIAGAVAGAVVGLLIMALVVARFSGGAPRAEINRLVQYAEAIPVGASSNGAPLCRNRELARLRAPLVAIEGQLEKHLGALDRFRAAIARGESPPLLSTDETARFAAIPRTVNPLYARLRAILEAHAGNAARLQDTLARIGGLIQETDATSAAMSERTESVATATEEVLDNLNTTAAAAEEMSASVRDIARAARDGAGVAAEANRRAESTSATMRQLGQAATEITNVTDMIKDIASQTNLLALNATIEAASAGEAGKGFAVVAKEIKELANQSAKAAEDIALKIEGVQANTDVAVGAIAEISGVIATLERSTQEISESVEQQTRAANDVSQSAAHIATVTREIAENIQEVNESTQGHRGQLVALQEAVDQLRGIGDALLGLVSGASGGTPGGTSGGAPSQAPEKGAPAGPFPRSDAEADGDIEGVSRAPARACAADQATGSRIIATEAAGG